MPPSLIFNHIYLLLNLVLKWNIYKVIPEEFTMGIQQKRSFGYLFVPCEEGSNKAL